MPTADVAAAYDRWAPIYDLLFDNAFANGRHQAIADAKQMGGSVIEVGAGTGIFAAALR
jgi:phosphatidylethanolamine/phosphatidyl-N-methylethanolamine N-methyltransferase